MRHTYDEEEELDDDEQDELRILGAGGGFSLFHGDDEDEEDEWDDEDEGDPQTDDEGFRLAKGNKFRTILDSFMYALLLAGKVDDVWTDFPREAEGSAARVALITGDLSVLLLELATSIGITEEALALNEQEVNEVLNAQGVVIQEGWSGLVEVDYYWHEDDAVTHVQEINQRGRVTLSRETNKRLSLGLDKVDDKFFSETLVH